MSLVKVNELLKHATENHYGVAAINTINYETIRCAIQAAEAERVPVIVQFYPGFDKYIPLIGSIFALSIGCNLISVVGLWSPTADLNTEAAWAIVVFVLIMYYKIKTNGILSYLKGLLDPIFIMAPINVLSEVSTPVSMAFRHFGNILSGTVISTLLYWALASLSHVVFGWLPGFLSQIQLFQIGIPAFTGLYFDWFGGCIQAFIFCTLTAIFIKRAAGED